MTPDTYYVRVGDSQIAYQVIGDGPLDLVYVAGLTSHLDMQWDHPLMARFLERLSSFTRLIMFDRRGAGLSDPVPLDALPTWEEWTDDLRAVLDAVGSRRAAIFAELDAGAMGLTFAATEPERTTALILSNTGARYLTAPDYPEGVSQEAADALVSLFSVAWGTDELVRLTFPSMADDDAFRRWRTRFARASATPRAAAAQYRYITGLDVRSVLPAIRVPTLVLHRAGFVHVPVAQGRYLAAHIDGARFVEVPGDDGWWFTQGTAEVLDLVEEFLTGDRRWSEPDRVLSTVLFTDIVDSTRLAADLGDRRWSALLTEHDAISRARIEAYRGEVVKRTGDGVLATFDGPTRAVRCALELRDALAHEGVQIRAGVHTGEIELRDGDIGGIAVHIAARTMAEAAAGDVLCTRTVRDLAVGSDLVFDDRGEHELRGVPERWHLYAALVPSLVTEGSR